MKNPLIASILTLLKTNLAGVSEFELLTALKTQFPEFNHLADDPELQLFRQHFLIMNALYQLQDSLWQEEQLNLSISALKIMIQPSQPDATGSTALTDGANAKLAAYYLDWNEYDSTSADEVNRLITSFYRRLANHDNRQSALDTLQIATAAPSAFEIKQQYRKLVKHHHPDAGGDPKRFIEIRQAYEALTL